MTEWISDSRAEAFANWLLNNVPGLPPILQTIHLLSIAAIMASAVFINLRALEWALPTQRPEEMRQRLQAWTWYGLLGVFSSGILFVLARPNRYFSNPVFQIKFALLFLAVLATFALDRLSRRQTFIGAASRDRQGPAKFIAFFSLLMWVGVVLAGRWIAYVEYLFWPG